MTHRHEQDRACTHGNRQHPLSHMAFGEGPSVWCAKSAISSKERMHVTTRTNTKYSYQCTSNAHSDFVFSRIALLEPNPAAGFGNLLAQYHTYKCVGELAVRCHTVTTVQPRWSDEVVFMRPRQHGKATVSFVDIGQVYEHDHVVGSQLALADVDLECRALSAPVLARAMQMSTAAMNVTVAGNRIVSDELPTLKFGLAVQQLHHSGPEAPMEAQSLEGLGERPKGDVRRGCYVLLRPCLASFELARGKRAVDQQICATGRNTL
eukprot:COSAG03_NODE_679_length_6346_cov_11.418601_7_plen_264_part_00